MRHFQNTYQYDHHPDDFIVCDGSAPYDTRPRKDDILWKNILEDIFEDFLCFVLPDARQHFDFSKGFSFLDKELEQLFPPENEDFRPQLIDKLVKVYTLKGEETWMLVHIEVQGKYSSDFPERMYNYFARIYDKHKQPVIAFAILTEPFLKERQDTFIMDNFGTRLSYRYNVFKISGQDEEALQQSDNPFAMAVLIAKSTLSAKRLSGQNPDATLMQIKVGLARRLLSLEVPKQKINSLFNFLRYYIRFPEEQQNIAFEQEINKITKTIKDMGIEEFIITRAKHEGKAEGILEGKIEGKLEGKAEGKIEEKRASQIKFALTLKAKNFSDDFIAEVTEMDIEQVRNLVAAT